MIAAFVLLFAAHTLDFGFARPGVTTPAAAISVAGEPDLDYSAWVEPAKIDVRIAPSTIDSLDARADEADAHASALVEVRVLAWSEDEDSDANIRLVFHGDKLWYAILPPTPSEATMEKLAARYGTLPAATEEARIEGDVRHSWKWIELKDRGVGYVVERGAVTARVIFAPKKKATP